MVTSGVDYVYAPKTTFVGGASGLVYGLIVGLPDRVVMLPKDALRGYGRSLTETRWSIGGRPLAEAVELVLADPSTTADELGAFVDGLAAGNGDALVVRIDELTAFKVKLGWFSRAVYWKKPEHRGWRALPIPSKPAATAFAAFYASKTRG